MIRSRHITALPSDIIVARHGRTKINQALTSPTEQELMRPLPLHDHINSIDLDPTGERQARNLGRYLLTIFPEGFAVCLSSDFMRVRRTTTLALPRHPEEAIVIRQELRERDRGDAADIPTWQFRQQFPEHVQPKADSPIDWRPPGKSQTLREKADQVRTLLPFLGRRAPDLPAILFASGEVVIASYVIPELGNMDDAQLKRGFAPGWSALAVDNAQCVWYTRRSKPDDSSSPLSSTFDHMMSIRAGEIPATDSGWIQIERH